MANELFATAFALLFLFAMFGLPIALIVAVYTGRIDIGLYSMNYSPSNRGSPQNIDHEEGETVVAAAEVKRSRWVLFFVTGLLFLPLVWGAPLIVYAWRLRKRPQYFFTDRRVVVERPEKQESFDADRVGQTQEGSTTVESFLNRGHVSFSTDSRQLHTISYLTNPEQLATTLRDLYSDDT